MDTMSAFMLWLGLTSLVPLAPTYEIEHFYTYNREHKQQALQLQKKVFIPENDAAENYVKKLKDADKIKAPHAPGWIITTQNNRLAIELMAKLTKDKIGYKPIVKWEGMDCVPTNTILLQTKPFVTEKLLRQRLQEVAKVKIVTLQQQGRQWAIVFDEFAIPSNMLVLANLIAEDTAWTDWARVVFTPIYASMSGSMNVTTPATLNLGYNKQLEVVITVYKPTVKIRKDLLPKLGSNFFVPQPPKDDVWYDFGPTSVTEEVSPEKTVIRMVTPFRYLNFGKVSIPSIQVAFDDNKQQGTFLIQGVDYNVQSVIADTEIEDIQAMPETPPLAQPPATDRFSRVILPWQRVGVAGTGAGLLLVLFVCAVVLSKAAAKRYFWETSEIAKRKLWSDLLHASRFLYASRFAVHGNNIPPENWREVYKDINEKLSKVLATFYNVHVPIASDCLIAQQLSPSLSAVLRELEKMYKPQAEPDVRSLVADVDLFVAGRENV